MDLYGLPDLIVALWHVGRNGVFLDRIRDHAMGVFSGALLVSCSPGPLKPLAGIVATAMCKYQLKRAMRNCLPFVKDRLERTAKLKGGVEYDWVPPVRTLPPPLALAHNM